MPEGGGPGVTSMGGAEKSKRGAGGAVARRVKSGMAAGDDDEARDAAIASRDAVGSALEAIDPDALTPREALAALYDLKRLLPK